MKTITNRLLLSTALASVIALGVTGCDRGVEKANAQQPKTVTQPIASATDTELSKQVTTAISNDTSLETSNIAITVTKGEVSLTGDVETEKQHEQALKVAREVSGVRTINDKLVVKEVAAAPY